jgi:hypothetical protein
LVIPSILGLFPEIDKAVCPADTYEMEGSQTCQSRMDFGSFAYLTRWDAGQP